VRWPSWRRSDEQIGCGEVMTHRTLDPVLDPGQAAKFVAAAGSRLGIGGVVLRRKPLGLLRQVVQADPNKRWDVSCFAGALDVELLAACRVLERCRTSYVGFEQLGAAPAFTAAVASGAIDLVEYSEFTFIAGLRAASAGLPWFPTRGAIGSEVVEALDFEVQPASHGLPPVVLVPPSSLDVALLHVDAVDNEGNVYVPRGGDFLFDLDLLIARAAETVVITAEEITSRSELVDRGQRMVLPAAEIDAFCHLPRGGAPGALAGRYEADRAGLRSYLEQARKDPQRSAGVLESLFRGSVE
jgi:glutaconate CoA-transferase, subunit A